MELINHTPFPSQAFAGVDQHGQSFHVIVLRQTLSFIDGALAYAPRQAPLCDLDEFFGAPNTSVRQESDLCHYKPRCDIIVNASAHAPLGKPAQRFPVRLVVKRPDTPALAPEHDQASGTLPSTGPGVPAGQANRGTSQLAQATPGGYLIDKKLEVTGERHFQQKRWPQRLLLQVLRWATLSLVRPVPWRLTTPGPFTSLQLRAEFAYGGQCRIDAGDVAAGRLRKQDRLCEEQLAIHPDSASPTQLPAAHAVYERNPFGLGFACQWELRARRRRSVSAPRIEHHGRPVTAKSWWHGLSATHDVDPAGLGVRPKSHPLRRALMGTIDAAFIQSGQALPSDFDFAIWNAAPPDQQTGFLAGDEVIELTNLSAHDGVGAVRDPSGNTVLRLALSGHLCYALVRLDDGGFLELPLSVDTVLVEPESHTLTLVWRAVMGIDPDVPIRRCELRMRMLQEQAAMRARIDALAQGVVAQEAAAVSSPDAADARS